MSSGTDYSYFMALFWTTPTASRTDLFQRGIPGQSVPCGLLIGICCLEAGVKFTHFIFITNLEAIERGWTS